MRQRRDRALTDTRQKPFAPWLLVVWIAAAGVARADDTDDFIRAQLKQQNIPGLSLAVLKDGVVIKTAGYGVADRKTQAPATSETVYKIASVSKQFIAAGIMVLAQERRLFVDDPVRKFIADVPAAWTASPLAICSRTRPASCASLPPSVR
jgi:CubicO group peptidase (beta-lactamase class C family)